MPFIPWAQQPALPPGAPEKAPKEKFKWTMPWQAEHWTEPQPEWTRTLGKAGLGIGLGAGGLALGMAAPGLAFGLGSRLPAWAGGNILANMGLFGAAHPALPAMGAGLAGLMGSAAMAPGGLGRGVTPESVVAQVPTAPITPTDVELPPPGDTEWQEPYLITDPQTGQLGWFNPDTGEFTPVRPIEPPGRLTPEQEIAQAEAERQATAARAQAEQEARWRELQEQYRLQMQLYQEQMRMQLEQAQQQQQAAIAQMYAADPYKYWAQLGMGTPGAVARLTGGQVGAGEQFKATPLSTPSAQWFNRLLPSEQQQITGAVNWMGVNPEDWYSMYQRMIPGLGQRQVQWAR